MSKISVEAIKDHAEKNYYLVANLIRQNGTPNPQFPADKDIEYSQLRDLAGAISGLGTILKNMKGKKMVDYRDPFIKDGTVITLIEDYYQSFVSQIITYDQIGELIPSGEHSGHTRSVAAQDSV